MTDTNTAMELTLHTAKVPRKGKGAKGFNTIESFGKPVVDKETGIASGFDYSFLKSFNGKLMEAFQAVVDLLESTRAMTQRAIIESAIRGIDDTLRSNTLRHELAKTELSEWILDNDLAETEDESKEVASLWAQTQEFQKKCNVLVNSKEDFAKERQKFVQKKKDAGVWKVVLATPVQLEAIPLATMLASASPENAKAIEQAIRELLMPSVPTQESV